MTLKPKKLQIERLPETSDAEAWVKFNERLNDLSNQGYKVLRATDTYILFSKKIASIRRED